MDGCSLCRRAGLIVLYLFVGPGLGIAAFFRGKGASASDVAALRAQIDRLVMEVSILQRRAAEGDPATEAAPPVQERVLERTPEPPADEVPAEPAAAEQAAPVRPASPRSEEHTSELQSLMRISYAVFCLKKKRKRDIKTRQPYNAENC